MKLHGPIKIYLSEQRTGIPGKTCTTTSPREKPSREFIEELIHSLHVINVKISLHLHYLRSASCTAERALLGTFFTHDLLQILDYWRFNRNNWVRGYRGMHEAFWSFLPPIVFSFQLYGLTGRALTIAITAALISYELNSLLIGMQWTSAFGSEIIRVRCAINEEAMIKNLERVFLVAVSQCAV